MKSKAWSVLLSVLIAFGMWLYVINFISPGSEDTYYNIPVVFEGETALRERELMITSSDAVSVTLRISGNRSDLNKINSSNITLKVDLSKIYDPGEHYLTYSISYPGDVPNGAVNEESRNPSYIRIVVEEIQRESVPVQIVFTGATPESYIADTEAPVLSQMEVAVEGPASVVSRIHHARIDVDLTDRTESVSENYRYTLCDEEGNPVDVALVTTDVAEVHMQLKVQRYKELELKMKTTYGGGATAENTTITIEPATIRVAGSDALLEKLDEIILGIVDLSSVEEDTEQSYDITLPEGVSNLTGITTATVKIQFKDLIIKEFEVDRIHAANVPEGMEYDLMNQVIKVRLRGKTELIEAIQPEDILITVDFKGKELGTFTIKPGIRVKGDKFASVGAVGTYSLSVTLKEAEDTE